MLFFFFFKFILGEKTIWENYFHNILHIDNAAILPMFQLNYFISSPRQNPQFLCF